jgi:hypothetical protein
MQTYGIINAEQDFPHQPYVAKIVFYQKNLSGHLLSRTDSFPNHAWLLTEEGSRLPGDNFGRDFYCDAFASKVNNHQ